MTVSFVVGLVVDVDFRVVVAVRRAKRAKNGRKGEDGGGFAWGGVDEERFDEAGEGGVGSG